MADQEKTVSVPVSTIKCIASHKPRIITDGGPWATHDMACAVYHVSEPAVLDLSCGVFQPSWKAKSDGWRLIKVNNRFQRFCLWISGIGPG